MRILCEKCGEIGSDQERWFYGMINEEKMPFQTIEKICSQNCQKCGGKLYTENGKYETMHDGTPYKPPTIAEKLGLTKFVKGTMKKQKSLIKKEKKELQND